MVKKGPIHYILKKTKAVREYVRLFTYANGDKTL